MNAAGRISSSLLIQTVLVAIASAGGCGSQGGPNSSAPGGGSSDAALGGGSDAALGEDGPTFGSNSSGSGSSSGSSGARLVEWQQQWGGHRRSRDVHRRDPGMPVRLDRVVRSRLDLLPANPTATEPLLHGNQLRAHRRKHRIHVRGRPRGRLVHPRHHGSARDRGQR